MFEFRSFLTLVLMLQLGARANEDLTTESPDFSKIVVVGTWDFENATAKAFETLKSGFSALDAIERGCSVCEELQCDGTVGYGGSPAENGETVLEAMIMDGKTSKVGAVASMRRIKSAISVARKVLENTKHSILAGDLATEFAKQMGFKEESLETDSSTKMWQDWKANNCQPNFWMNVNPDPTKFCGPYKPIENLEDTLNEISSDFGRSGNHDTIGMIAIDAFGNVASGTSTNGAKFKISGRVGDSPIPGAGSYADNEVGAAAATGDGDVMLRFLPSFLAVELMRNGLTPELACKTAIERITAKYPDFSGAVIAVNVNGTVGASCHGMEEFPFTMGVPEYDEIVLMRTRCV